jgi:nicotinamidase-related amidase
MDRIALIVIDAQQEYFAPIGKVVLPQAPDAVKRVAAVLEWARGKIPIIHVTHESTRPGAPIFQPGSPALEIHPLAAPLAGEPVLKKHLPGSFTGTDLEAMLRKQGIERVVLSGFMTQMCVDTTSRQAAHLGFKVTVLSDATAAMDVKAPDGTVIPAADVHRTHLGSLSGFLAEITPSDALMR